MKTKILGIVLVIVLIFSLGMNIGTIIQVMQHRQYMLRFDRRDHFPPPRPPLPFSGDDLPNSLLGKKLKLNETQIKTIMEIHLQTNLKIDSIMQNLDSKRKKLMDLLQENNPDETKLDTLFNEMSVLQSKIERCLFENMRQTEKVFTPEQQKQFFELLKKGLFHREHFEHPDGFGPEQGPGHGHPPMFPPDEER